MLFYNKFRKFNTDMGLVGKCIVCIVAILLAFRLLNYHVLSDTYGHQGEILGGSVNNGYCWSSEEEINKGTEDLLPLLNRITSKQYYRYFKVNIERPCPFWAVHFICTSKENPCSVCRCDENNIPKELHEPTDMSEYPIPDAHISQIVPHPINVDNWGSWKTKDDNAEYVDLLQNPEANTGFIGPMAAKVWQAIYKENCFSCNQSNHTESFVFRRLLSGLQTSISVHVFTNFFRDPKFESPLYKSGLYNNPNISFFPNCKLYREKLQPNKEFIQNLYALFQFTLRALTKAKSSFIDDLKSLDFTENSTIELEHQELHSDLMELF
ncbi:unnamed protein product [Phytomonas sp. EM1]|nr:unnamed protein product [Phytomonas sp. EM1]|eukprot:CCW64636.1 unnamed protein product [Phytomonas sp. isolate EM1]